MKEEPKLPSVFTSWNEKMYGFLLNSRQIDFGVDTYPSSSSASSLRNHIIKTVLTEIFWVRINSTFGLFVCEEVVHLNLSQETVGSLKPILLDLNHANLFVKHGHLAEVSLGLHAVKAFESSWPLTKSFLKPLLESPTKIHHLCFKN